MEKFEVHILGCGSALPTLRHWPSSQIINLREKLFMIDCGEGTQVQFRRSRQKFSRLSHIFISHLHGDHIFGLIGLLSTLALSGRTAPMHIYAAAELEGLLRPQLDFFCKGITFDVEFHPYPAEPTSLSSSTTTVPFRSMPYRCATAYRRAASFSAKRPCCLTFAAT